MSAIAETALLFGVMLFSQFVASRVLLQKRERCFVADATEGLGFISAWATSTYAPDWLPDTFAVSPAWLFAGALVALYFPACLVGSWLRARCRRAAEPPDAMDSRAASSVMDNSKAASH